MAENQPPDTSTTAASNQPGRPYYESLRTTLRGTIAKKKALDEQLAALEENIYKMESSYLEETGGAGNIVRGFDNWVKGVVIGTDKRGDDRKTRVRVRDEDRIFSRSSISWVRSQESPNDSSAANTPSHAPTPASSVPPALSARASDHNTPTSATLKSGNKKKKLIEKDDEDDGKPAKRSKISYGRG